MIKQLKYKVSFVNRLGVLEQHIWEFQLHDTAAAHYGNLTSVSVFHDNDFLGIVDTRYDNSVLKDFDQWCNSYMRSRFNMQLNPTWEVLS